ncbi:helix-turn-helix domain-containing protein [Spirulina major CS-329]|uniref:helix-turn-helix transcriptional regulator n=1 Tax=Spirulina TaxID=1154 RepID=UPI0023308182|nr:MULTISPECIES: helix-turn-helix domain-containing protein [Spirulina]MDB9494662.1 helix-turn-helix domain-containing protein [Spirulina subsalsa CS-330]MDB9503679.1 helix-turn-helix domain-containing protein [Spirulina major CS-329]
MRQNLTPARVVAPGKILLRELTARGSTPTDLAKMINRDPQVISEILNSAIPITPEIASDLSAALGTSEMFWINLESNYRRYLARQQQPV